MQAFCAEQIAQKQSLGNQTGEAYSRGLEFLKSKNPHQEAEGADYVITVMFEKAAGWYVSNDGGSLEWWAPPEEQNAHLEVIVQDNKDLRFLPSLDIEARLLDANDNEVERKQIDFIWHPYVYHYAENFKVPSEGDYSVEVTVQPPTFRRHDEVKGDRYKSRVTAKLGPFHLPMGRKPHGPE